MTRRAADEGAAGAQCLLGMMYMNGDGVPSDSAEAVKWYRKAAGQDYAPGEACLGVMYSTGAGVPKDLAEAAKWYREAGGSYLMSYDSPGRAL